jgi:hypothetical protein
MLLNHFNQVMNLTDHTTGAGSILNLNNLRNLVKTKGKKGILLIYRSTDTALDLLDFNCCHCKNLLLLTVKNFIH